MSSKIKIDSQHPRFETAPELYGLFFEDINHAADGGLYPEMLRNRAFEDSLIPAGCTTDPDHTIYINDGEWPGCFNHGEGMDEWCAAVPYTEIPAWYASNAEMTVLTEGTLNQNRLAALEVKFQAGGEIKNIGYCGLSMKEGDNYNFYMMVKTAEDCEFTVSMKAEDGRVASAAKLQAKASSEYQTLSAVLTASLTDHKGVLTISCDKELTVVFGFTSMLPEKTYKGHGLREDLALALKNTHSKFIRFPGGCVVEGINNENALRFSRTIGPVWERPSAMLMWHYRTTNGLGYHEYLQLCEDLDMKAMYVCNCGISCQARHGHGFEPEVVQEYLDEALGALEYALGDVTTKYGAMRAANGHPEPFPLKYLEIGNENMGPIYIERYEKFYKALKEAYPDVIYVANNHAENFGQTTEIVDEHFYSTPEFFLENVDQFDNYDRQGPDIFVGEYAVNGGKTIASMECALAEAAFLLGMERNQDIVKLSAYAPLFQNLDYTAWLPNLIVFNNHEVYGIPTYHAISLLAKYRGKQVLPVETSGDKEPPVYVGTPGIYCENEGLLMKNIKVNGKDAVLDKQIYGDVKTAEADAEAITIVPGENRHHYLGKNDVWNKAFEHFIFSGPQREKPILWCTFEGPEENQEAYTFEADLKFNKEDPVVINILNYSADTDAGCNEPHDHSWNRRNVRNQTWKLENGVSTTRVPNWFEAELQPEEKADVEIDYTKYNHYKIVCDRYGFDCYINDVLVHGRRHTLHSLVHSAALMDDDSIIVKLVNAGDKEADVEIELDQDVQDAFTAEIMEADLTAQNSFEKKENVSSYMKDCTGASKNFTYKMGPNSIHVLVLKK